MPHDYVQHHVRNWSEGYEEGYVDGLEEAWLRIRRMIKEGPLPFAQQAERNGLMRACNLVANIKDNAIGKRPNGG